VCLLYGGNQLPHSQTANQSKIAPLIVAAHDFPNQVLHSVMVQLFGKESLLKDFLFLVPYFIDHSYDLCSSVNRKKSIFQHS
jgi:hypothetical protein